MYAHMNIPQAGGGAAPAQTGKKVVDVLIYSI